AIFNSSASRRACGPAVPIKLFLSGSKEPAKAYIASGGRVVDAMLDAFGACDLLGGCPGFAASLAPETGNDCNDDGREDDSPGHDQIQGSSGEMLREFSLKDS